MKKTVEALAQNWVKNQSDKFIEIFFDTMNSTSDQDILTTLTEASEDFKKFRAIQRAATKRASEIVRTV